MILKPHSINQHNNFISGWYIDKKICTEMIRFFENNKNNHIEGTMTSDEGDGYVDKSKKDSTDLPIQQFSNKYPIKNYLNELSVVVDCYKKIYPYSSEGTRTWRISPAYNIQRYNPNQGFHCWHTERSGLANTTRHLVFMTYLNDVTDGGETEWYHQKIKVTAEKGLTIIWPADWTFLHRGVVSKTQTKYIATGWYNFYE